MLELTALADLIYAQSDDYQNVLSSIEYLIMQDDDAEQKERAYKAFECCLRDYGARTPTSEYLLKQLATAEKRDIITTGNLLHLGNCTQTENEPPLVSPNHLLYGVDETASVLGVGRDTVLAWAKDPTFPAFRTGNGKNAPIRVNAAGLQPWIDEQCKGEV